MRHLIMIIAALMVLAGPTAIQSRANDAHHPEKATVSKKAKKPKPKQQQKKPAEKTGMSQQQGERSIERGRARA